MSSNTAFTDTPTCLTLISPSNFQIMAKLWRENVLDMALRTDTCPITSLSLPSTTITVPVPAMSLSIPVWKWTEQNERAHGIIQGSISDALLLKMEMYTTTQDLFDTLLFIHQASNLASAFYIFQQLFDSAWSGGSAISEYITSLRTLEALPCWNGVCG
ncbi:hypothetical protein PAXRUDRAFT_176116 [Paxillus rubicundulus Ve08.2h10]|uniref:Uncharacterized protein n=1 Tax=Paxillus rubicundulus Ve08.2h10 TaxID=930991 RepID=A0A0D0CG22_9AGAM|nr:hypothetical protein PAXRUDRAFT_176116 [Paxillus rubicundulus Ve08.2h10]